MSGIKYRVHFTFLLFAAALLYFAFNNSRLSAAVAGWRPDAYFGSVGLLHATALVLALRVNTPFIRRMVFVLMATVLSIAAPVVGPAIVAVIGLQNEVGFFSALAAASAVGACAYWMLVRTFWLGNLVVVSLIRTVCFCVVATLASFLVAGIVTGQGSRQVPITDDLPTIFWWVAFSFSLFLADRPQLANTPLQPTAGRRGG
jgi:hypothetical protein